MKIACIKRFFRERVIDRVAEHALSLGLGTTVHNGQEHGMTPSHKGGLAAPPNRLFFKGKEMGTGFYGLTSRSRIS